MADHININEPWSQERHWNHYREIARLKSDLELANRERDQYRSDLDAIFTRVKRGDPVELHYPDGLKIIVIAQTAEFE